MTRRLVHRSLWPKYFSSFLGYLGQVVCFRCSAAHLLPFPFWISCWKAEILILSPKWSARGRSRSTGSSAANCRPRRSPRPLFTEWGFSLLTKSWPSPGVFQCRSQTFVEIYSRQACYYRRWYALKNFWKARLLALQTLYVVTFIFLNSKTFNLLLL